MAEKEYTVVAPDGKEITLVGPAGASQEEVIAQAQKLYKPTVSQPVSSKVSDLPTPFGTKQNVNVLPEQPRSLKDYAKVAYEVPATVVSGAVAPFLGVGKGIIQNIQQGTNERVDRPELAQQFVYEPTSPVSQDILGSMGKTFEAAKIPAYVPGAGQLASSVKQATQITPLPSFAQSTTQKLSQALKKEPVVEPVTGEVKSTVGQRYKEAFTPEPKPTYATAEQLETASKDLFTKAKQSGLEINPKDFAKNMKEISVSLEDLGYDPELYPQIDTVVKRLTNPEVAKDFNKLKALRTMVGNLQATQNPAERKIATQLKYDFDNYLASLPEESIVGGSKEGVNAWKEARNVYSKLSKSQIFDDMLETAKLEKGKYSQAGIEQSLYNQLKNLAKNDKRMRMFTAEEQDAIRKATEGTDLQNTLKFIGKFAPTSTVSSILPLLATSASAPVGLIGTTAAIGSRAAAAQMRKNQVEQLANLMRGTVNPEWQAQPKPVNEQLLKMLRMNQGE